MHVGGRFCVSRVVTTCRSTATITFWSQVIWIVMCGQYEQSSQDTFASPLVLSTLTDFLLSRCCLFFVVRSFWSPNTGELMHDFEDLHSGQVTSVEFSKDGTHIVTCSRDNTVKIVDIRTYK